MRYIIPQIEEEKTDKAKNIELCMYPIIESNFTSPIPNPYLVFKKNPNKKTPVITTNFMRKVLLPNCKQKISNSKLNKNKNKIRILGIVNFLISKIEIKTKMSALKTSLKSINPYLFL